MCEEDRDDTPPPPQHTHSFYRAVLVGGAGCAVSAWLRTYRDTSHYVVAILWGSLEKGKAARWPHGRGRSRNLEHQLTLMAKSVNIVLSCLEWGMGVGDRGFSGEKGAPWFLGETWQHLYFEELNENLGVGWEQRGSASFWNILAWFHLYSILQF